MAKELGKLGRAALRYAKRGWPVFPLHGIREGRCTCGKECAREGKHPRTPRGFKDATTDRKQIRDWWHRWPSANIGVRTGKRARLVVVDVDGKNGRRAWKKLQEELGITSIKTRTSVTGKGEHILFGTSEMVPSSVARLAPGVDVRAEHGYFVAPPSKHIRGRQYHWKDYDVQIADMPVALLQRAQHRDVVKRKPESTPTGQLILEGERNTTLTRFAGAMGRPGMSLGAIEAALMVENRDRPIQGLLPVSTKTRGGPDLRLRSYRDYWNPNLNGVLRTFNLYVGRSW